MTEEKLIDPAWLVKARRDRKMFALRVLLVFAILSVLAWWALPRLEAQHGELTRVLATKKKGSPWTEPLSVRFLLSLAGWFKALWVAIGIGCAAAILLGFTGKIDSLLIVLNIAALLVGVGAVGLTIYVFYAPTLLLIEGKT
jgi:hypothetical protein